MARDGVGGGGVLRRRGRVGSIRAGLLVVAMLGLMAAAAGGTQPYEGYGDGRSGWPAGAVSLR